LHNTRENKTQITGQELVKQTRNELNTSKPEKKTGLNASKLTGDRVNGIKYKTERHSGWHSLKYPTRAAPNQPDLLNPRQV